ncbi:MAG: DUF2807 domain-containing protein [Lutibacter sp.]|nr:DUF2807 domain-containing protein [Lutibacter sp.]
MKKLVLVILFINATLFAQEPITTNLGDFNEVKIYNGLTVVLKKSDVSKIVVSGSQAQDVSIKNADGVLKIRLKFPESFIAENAEVVLYYSKNIGTLDANEGAQFVSKEELNQQHLEVRTQEGAKINLEVAIKHLVVKSVSGGIITLTGTADNQNVEVNTGGIYNGFDLVSKQATVNSAAGSTADVRATDILDAKAQFGGAIYYKGRPEVLNTKTVLKGTIKLAN